MHIFKPELGGIRAAFFHSECHIETAVAEEGERCVAAQLKWRVRDGRILGNVVFQEIKESTSTS